jgi:DNA replication and repair protein RecF
VYLSQLRIQNLRNIGELELDLAPGFNAFTGGNGAGKTSLLEAAWLLSHGSSFRTSQTEHLIRRGADELALFGQIATVAGGRRLGLRRQQGRWTARIDGETPPNLGTLFAACAVTGFEPGSHALISGSAELRRGFIDWGVFHVEHDFAVWSRRFRRALRQRNALLKQDADAAALSAWDVEFVHAAEYLTAQRERYIALFRAALVALLQQYLPELGRANLEYRAGWDRAIPLAQVLVAKQARDRLLGHTSRGPHRADWRLSFELAPSHEHLSRGQEKLCAIACMLAQARLFHAALGEWPVIVLDDFCSELDAAHQELALASLVREGAQVLLTGTELLSRLVEFSPPQRWFHVEHGQVRALL